MSLHRSKVVLSLVMGLVVGVMLSSLQLSCGVVQPKTACAAEECPAGPEGPPGPQGPAGPEGPRGPSFGSCQWHYTGCNAAPGVECQMICPTGTHPIAGGCDITANGTIAENRPSVGTPTFPPTPAAFDAYDRWVCESSAGNVQTTYAVCCTP